MTSIASDNVSYRLVEKLSDLVICSGCLQKGIVTRIPQVISSRHALTNECVDCRQQKAHRPARRGKVVRMARPAR